MAKYDYTIFVVATHGYYELAIEQMENIKKFSNGEDKIQYIIATNRVQDHPFVEHVYIDHAPWPWITIKKFEYLIRFAHKLQGEYVMLQDADTAVWGRNFNMSLFKHKLFAVQHHMDGWFWKTAQEKPFERNPQSLAYVNPEGQVFEKPYVMGAIFGGKKDDLLYIAAQMQHNIKQDLANDIMPCYHEESHWNNYVYYNEDIHVIPCKDYYKIFAVSSKGKFTIEQLRG